MMTELTLDRCPPGHGGKILRVGGAPDLAQRLLELGFVPGTPVSVVKCAPLGDPLQVTVRGYHLSLRKREAHNIVLAQ
jgi:Fe2+ transport system protein FeoA